MCIIYCTRWTEVFKLFLASLSCPRSSLLQYFSREQYKIQDRSRVIGRFDWWRYMHTCEWFPPISCCTRSSCGRLDVRSYMYACITSVRKTNGIRHWSAMFIIYPAPRVTWTVWPNWLPPILKTMIVSMGYRIGLSTYTIYCHDFTRKKYNTGFQVWK